MASVAQSIISASLPTVVETIEVRSRFSPPVIIRTADLLKPSAGPPNPVVRQVKPTIILKGSIGQQVIAPAGVVGPNEWKLNVALLGGGIAGAAVLVTAGIFMTGRRSGKKKSLEGVDLGVGGVFAIGIASSIIGGLVAAKILGPKT